MIVDCSPDEYKHAFAIKTSDGQNLVFYTKLRVERDIMLHEVNLICKRNCEQVEQMSARNDAIDRMDPIQSFNIWNLSSVCGPVQVNLNSTDRK